MSLYNKIILIKKHIHKLTRRFCNFGIIDERYPGKNGTLPVHAIDVNTGKRSPPVDINIASYSASSRPSCSRPSPPPFSSFSSSLSC